MRHQLLPRAAGRSFRPNPILYTTMLGPLTTDDWQEAKRANVTLRQIEACGLLVADEFNRIYRLHPRRAMAELQQLLESHLFRRLAQLFRHLMDVRFRPLKRLGDDDLLFFSLRLDHRLCGQPRT